MGYLEELIEKARQGGNAIIVAGSCSIDKTVNVSFRGQGNILFLEDGVQIKDSKIEFFSNNAVVYLSKNAPRYYSVSIHVYGATSVFIGKSCSFNKQLTLVTSERQNIIIGNDCMFSFGIYVRCADPHLIYDISSKKRINPSKSVIIGDHVWIGQSALILKGTTIGSGSIVSANAVTTKKYPSNSCIAGNPARIVKENVFFTRDCVHDWQTTEMSDKYEYMDTDRFVFNNEGCTLDFKEADKKIKEAVTGNEKLELIKHYLADNQSKHRFTVLSDNA